MTAVKAFSAVPRVFPGQAVHVRKTGLTQRWAASWPAQLHAQHAATSQRQAVAALAHKRQQQAEVRSLCLVFEQLATQC